MKPNKTLILSLTISGSLMPLLAFADVNGMMANLQSAILTVLAPMMCVIWKIAVFWCQILRENR